MSQHSLLEVYERSDAKFKRQPFFFLSYDSDVSSMWKKAHVAVGWCVVYVVTGGECQQCTECSHGRETKMSLL